jgi:hypothetical protein
LNNIYLSYAIRNKEKCAKTIGSRAVRINKHTHFGLFRFYPFNKTQISRQWPSHKSPFVSHGLHKKKRRQENAYCNDGLQLTLNILSSLAPAPSYIAKYFIMEVKVMLLRIGLSAGRNLIWVMED